MPGHPPGEEVGVTVYVTVCGVLVVFTRVLLNVADDCAVVLSPVTFGLAVATQLKVEATDAVNGMLIVPPLQIVPVFVLVMVGMGFTVIVVEADAEPQAPVPVTVYVVVVVGEAVTLAPVVAERPVVGDQE